MCGVHLSTDSPLLLSFDSPSRPGPAETVGHVGHLPYHFLVVHTGNDACCDFYPR